MELHHKTLLEELRIDRNGIFASGCAKKSYRWETIVGIIGYRKRKLLGLYYCIGIAMQDEHSEILYFSPFVTRDIWKYIYILESLVRYLIDNHRAIGGKTWCARPLDQEGRIVEDNDLYRSYVLSRILADRIGVPWFDHTDDEEGVVALTYLSKLLIKDGTEYMQLSEAIKKTRFQIQENGYVDMIASTGYGIFDHARSIISSEKAQQSDPSDAG